MKKDFPALFVKGGLLHSMLITRMTSTFLNQIESNQRFTISIILKFKFLSKH